MIIDERRCIGCGSCAAYCGVRAIRPDGEKMRIDLDACCECGTCLRAAPCPTGALMQQELDEVRAVRRQFSDPTATLRNKGQRGRGTEEVKTNDVTGHYQPGTLGILIELGRPSVGARMSDVETLARAMAAVGVEWEERCPVLDYFEDRESCTVKLRYRNERALDYILEFRIPEQRLPQVVAALRAAAERVDTVFSVSMISTFNDAMEIPALAVLDRLGVAYRRNPKINLGMGRPLAPMKKEG